MGLTQNQINAINNINMDFQNHQIGTLLGQALGGEQPNLSISLAELAASSVDNTKLVTDVKIGSLASLTTSNKSSIQAAINELVTNLALKVDETSEIKNLFSGPLTLNGGNPSPVAFQGDTAGEDVSSNIETFDLNSVGDGGTILIDPDGSGEDTATFNVAVGTSVSGASPSQDISAGSDNKFKISVGGDASEEVTLVLAGLNTGANIATEMQTKIRALGGNKALVTVVWTAVYTITDPILGTNSAVVITRATGNNVTEELKIGASDGGVETGGTGDAGDDSAVTAQEIVDLINGDMTGLTASVVGGAVVITSDTTGKDSSILIGNGTLNAALGFTNADIFHGAQGLGLGSDMANTNYRVMAIITGVASGSLGALDLSITNKTTAKFHIECETAGSSAIVDIFVMGELA